MACVNRSSKEFK
jgi:hypothetical protein